MNKETVLRLRCTDEYKLRVERAAQKDKNTSKYIERLLEEDMKKQGI